MSDLQMSLLAIGVVVVGGVYLFNWLQERALKRKLEKAFGAHREADDVLLDGREAGTRAEPGMPEEAVRASRVEPHFIETDAADDEPMCAAPPAVAETPPPAPGVDESIYAVAGIDSNAPIPAAVVDELIGKCAALGKPCHGLGFSAAAAEWEDLARNAGDVYVALRLGLQLANRAGPATAAEIAAFCDAVRTCAERCGASARCPDVDAASAQARDLDAFCAEVDIAIGINIIAREGDAFSGTKVRAHAEAAGFKLEPDGVFRYRDERRETLFTLDNHEPAPFLPEQVKRLTTRGVTLLLDVPRVAGGPAVLHRMFEVARGMAMALGARMVDDNRAPLNEAGIGKISEQVGAVQDTMQARGIAAGSERALRLFS